jgi:hypothetical protein
VPRVEIDDLFDGGLELGRDVVVKAQLRFRVRPPAHPVAQAAVDRAVSAYDERLDMILDEVAGILRQADVSDVPLVIVSDPVAKAVSQPFRPGSRGGKWYRDARGNIRYGDPPEGRFMGNAANAPASARENVTPFHSGPFMGDLGRDQALTGFLVERGASLGFSDGELRFLSAWYGDGENGGELFDAFLECAQLTRDDLKGGVANLRFGSQGITYDEAVFEFFAAQESLFMGDPDEDDDGPTTGRDRAWQSVLHDEIKPLLAGVFAKYEEAKADDGVQQAFAGEPLRLRRRFAERARRCAAEVDGIADATLGDPDPSRLADMVVVGMQAIGLIARASRAERSAYVHGRPHLSDAVVVDAGLVKDGDDGPLLRGDGLASLTPSQLVLVHVAAELHRRWDPHARLFSAEGQSEAGSGDLGEATLSELSGRSAAWAEASRMVRGRLSDLVDRVVARLNEVNSREGMPVRHGPARRSR